jgi:methylenetetrahydrofolate/methylenetetrahydromethanopterin dehydrogenase (NADP+)
MSESSSEKRKILIQLDTDTHPSSFDRVVAIDAGADEVFSYGGVKPGDVTGLVHGAIFTRGPKDLHRTALFIGGSDVQAGEEILKAALAAMQPAYGLRVSVLLDVNGANTTAAAAVLAAARHLDLKGARALVLGGTGPVGGRVALLLASKGAVVRVGSRKLDRATAMVDAIRGRVPNAAIEPIAVAGSEELPEALNEQTLVIAAGAAGVVLLPKWARMACPTLKMVIDLNAVPPLGIEGVGVADRAVEHDGLLAYGALGVGGTKMKLHRRAIARLFESNDQVLDAEQVYALGETL